MSPFGDGPADPQASHGVSKHSPCFAACFEGDAAGRGAEALIEAAYPFVFRPGMAIRPSVQYIVLSGARIENAPVFGLRRAIRCRRSGPRRPSKGENG